MATREATPSDLGSTLEVVLSAMPHDPDWNYRYKYRDQYPEDHLKNTKLLFQLYIDPSYDDWHIMVAEAPSLEDSSVTKVVAFVVWNVSYINKRKHGCDYRPNNPVFNVDSTTRKDANPERVKVFREILTQEQKKHFNDAYGDNQIYLHLLGTHTETYTNKLALVGY